MDRYLSKAVAGTGGTIKESPEDFRVEEIPLYLPCGEGEHLYIEVEKQGLTTFDLLHQLSRALGVKEREMGYAGLKDARATTRQTVSAPGVAPERALEVQIEGVRILSARRHRNKLRPGHLAGNRFEIRIRDPREGSLEAARDVLHILESLGVPNAFGEQRYGSFGNSHLIGRAILLRDFAEAIRQIIGDPAQIKNQRWREGAERFAAGDLRGALEALPGRLRDERRLVHILLEGGSAEAAVMGMPRKLLRLYLSAIQSHLFDRIVAMRLDSLETLWPGDLAYKHDNGACFAVTDPAAEQPRAERFEISPSGPLFGCKVTLARGKAGILEESLLEKEGLALESFRIGQGLTMEGERRALRVPLQEPGVRLDGADLVLSFALPRGSYATSVLREIIKPGQESAAT
ncbi:tRNA pseudouridine synthase D [Desulfuromonas versatilis]|uniref:tRNA pseudouridine synthase D n=1 Tax=Desulfuromonas versatilis TaxID=2802975 RepID=A0ABM8HYD8_9BACT|nr:tRNA pseudouridine(13) synthase TruD [Desulfuromonas versatilis]BCR06121.1 tRNA pseudouridine synthase D [Desulfuromonas versatilis]